MKIRKKTITNYIIVIFGIGFNRGIAFINSVLIARILGPGKFGEFAIFQIVMILTWQFAQAFDTTYVRYAKSSTSDHEKGSYLKSTLLMKFIYISAVWIIACPLSFFIAQKVFAKPEVSGHIFKAIICGGFLAFLMTCGSFFQAKEKFGIFSMINASFPVIVACSLVGFFLLKGFLILDVVINIYFYAAIIVGLICIIFLLSRAGNPLRIEKDFLSKSFNLSKWILGVTIVFFVFQRIDTLFLTRIMKFENIGIYFAATQIVMFVSLLSGPLSNVFLPMASTALESKDALKLYFKESLAAISIVNIFIFILMIFAPVIIQAIFGQEYGPAVTVLRILLAGWVFWIVYQPFSYLFYTLDDSRTRFALESMKLAIGIILLIKLVPLYGITGAALSIAGAFVLNTIFSVVILWKKILIKLNLQQPA